MTQPTEVDVVVLGLGPGGEAAANKLGKAGLDVVGIDRGLVGGECPYYGCVPSKMMIRAANTLAESRRVRELAGSSTTESGWAPVAARIRDQATDDWDDTAAVERLQGNGARVVRGHGRLVGPRTVEVDGQVFRARRGVVLNTGTAPGVPPIDGLSDTPYWTNRDIVKVTELPGSLAVIGGGAIGCELAQAFARFGVRVTVIEGADRILGVEEPEASALVASVFTREGIRLLTGVEAQHVDHGDGRFVIDLDGESVEAEKLLVATGRDVQLQDIGLETVGVDVAEARSLDVDGRMHVLADGSVVEGLWAVGDITGKGPFTHTAIYESSVAVRDVLGENGPEADFRAVPRVTFTDPEVGAVGLTEKQARDQGLDVRTGTADVAESARGWMHAVGNEGLVKLVADGDLLVGSTSVGPTGGEVLSMLTTAIHGRVPVSELRTMIYAYPTFHGAVRDALSDLG